MKPTQTLLLKNCTGIVSGVGFKQKKGRAVKDKDLEIVNGPIDVLVNLSSGMIQEINPKIKSNPTTEFYDASGLLLTSAFYDSHTHSLFAGSRAKEYFLRWGGKSYVEISKEGGGIHNTMRDTLEGLSRSDQVFLNEFEERLRQQYLQGSCVVEIKTGYAPNADGELELLRFIKSFSNRPRFNTPKILSTFLPLHALPKGAEESSFVASMTSLLPTVQKENLAQFVDAFPESGFFTIEAAEKLFIAAKKHKLKIKVHADELTSMGATETFSAMGAISVDHLQKISQKGLDALAKFKTVATLLPATSFFSNIPYVNARRILDAGARVALASDLNPGTAPQPGLKLTMQLAASQLFMTASEILCGLTFNGAQALDFSDGYGVVKEGSPANLLLWKLQSQKNLDKVYELIIEPTLPIKVFSLG
jgi:imidazolonepropionase